MLMVDNRVELWETMLAVMKAGAVILPTSIVLGPAQLAERIDRAAACALSGRYDGCREVDDLDPDLVRVIIGASATALASVHGRRRRLHRRRGVVVSSGDASIVYFTSGTTSRPKMVEHTQHLSYPVGTSLSTMYWIGVQPGDVHMTISAPGWGSTREPLLRADRRGERVVYNYRRFDAAALAEQPTAPT
jgi:acetyl-CoA synthetase